MTRALTLRENLGWSQKAMAEFLGIEQPSVWRLENQREENGPESRLLSALESGLRSGLVAPTASPTEALGALGLQPLSPSSVGTPTQSTGG